MRETGSYRGLQIALGVLLAAAILIWLFVRPPAQTAASRLADGVDATGQARGLVAETVQAVRALETVGPEASAADIARHRQRIATLQAACAHLRQEIDAVQSSWIPVGEASALLDSAGALAQLALDRTPTRPVTPREAAQADALETAPDRTGLTPETVALLQARAAQVLDHSERLREAVRQAAVNVSLVRGTLFGFEAPELLLVVLVLSVLLGAAALWHAESRLRTPPMKAMETELRLVARTSPQEAIASCYSRSARLLELADIILAQSELPQEAADARVPTAAAG